MLDDFMLRNGYAVASSSLNVFGNNCQEVTAAETMMMTKEHFIEQYGPVAHTQGFGCSGGSYQQHQIADDYPGLLDGILPGCSFPEVTHATVSFITDAWLLDHYFTTTGSAWSDEQKRAVTGFATYATAPNVAVGARRIDPREFRGVVPEEQRYDPADYRAPFTAAERTRLHAIFPGGVCDWSRPGAGQRPPAGTWLSFGAP